MSGEKDHTYLQARMFLLLSVNCQFLQNQQSHVSHSSMYLVGMTVAVTVDGVMST